MRIVALGLLVAACSNKPDPRMIEVPVAEVCELALAFREHNDQVRKHILDARDRHLKAAQGGSDPATYYALGMQLVELQRARYLASNSLRLVVGLDPRFARVRELAYELSGGVSTTLPSDNKVEALGKPLEDALAKVHAAEKAIEDECGRVMTSIR